MQSSLLDLMENSPRSGRTSPASSATKETPLGASWEDLSAHWMPYLHLPGEAGPVKVWLRGLGHGRLGPFSTPNGSEWRSGGSACSLSSILEAHSIPPRFFLSRTACAGIIRRAEKRGKSLPPSLHAALAAVASGRTSTATGGLIEANSGDVGYCLTASGQNSLDAETETLIAVAHSLRGEGFDASEDGTGRGTPIVPVSFVQNTRDEVRLMGGDGSIVGALPAEPGAKQQCYVAQPVAFDCKGTEVQFSTDGTHPTLRSMGHDGSHQNGGGHAAVAFAIQERATCENPNAGPDGAGFRGDGAAYTLEARPVPQAVATPWAVRRLTPTECARLQAFPDDHTRIPWRGKPPDQCPDGPQYKALGNSMCTSVVAWIMNRMRISMSAAAMQWAGPAETSIKGESA